MFANLHAGDLTESKKVIEKVDEEAYLHPKIKVENIVVSASLHAVIDLYELSKNVRAVDYEPEQFPGAIFKISDPKAVIILFKNGKMICTGANTMSDIKKVLDYAASVISKYAIELIPPEQEAKSNKGQ